MIKRLRTRFVATIMTILSLIFALVIGSINFLHYQEGNRQAEKLLETVAHYKGDLSLSRSGQARLLYHYCYVALDSDQRILSFTPSSDFYSELKVQQLVNEALAQDEESGYISDHQQYLLVPQEDGCALVFLDQTLAYLSSYRLLIISFVLGLACLVLFFFIALRWADWMLRPVEEAFNRQKQFISDASHELKTPLSVISANAEVLASDIGENRFLSYIQSETVRMDHLVQDLLTLARLENPDQILPETFNLSRVVLQAALPFESTAFEAGKSLSFHMQENVQFSGYAGSIQQLVAILLDNAIKYSDEHGSIELSLTSAHGHAVLEVYNTGPGIASGSSELIFQRFYRGDQAHNRTEGSYGLGLSIARSIAEKHGGWMEVESEVGKFARFRAVL